MFACQFLVGDECVIDENVTPVIRLCVFLFVNDGIAAAFLQGCFCKPVAVERCPFQGDEDTSLRAVAAVGRHDRVASVNSVNLLYVHTVSFIVWCKGNLNGRQCKAITFIFI